MSYRANQAAAVLDDTSFKRRVLTSEVDHACKWGEYAAYVIYDNGEHYIISCGKDIKWPRAYCEAVAAKMNKYRPCWVVLLIPYEWELEHLRELRKTKQVRRMTWKMNQQLESIK